MKLQIISNLIVFHKRDAHERKLSKTKQWAAWTFTSKTKFDCFLTMIILSTKLKLENTHTSMGYGEQCYIILHQIQNKWQ